MCIGLDRNDTDKEPKISTCSAVFSWGFIGSVVFDTNYSPLETYSSQLSMVLFFRILFLYPCCLFLFFPLKCCCFSGLGPWLSLFDIFIHCLQSSTGFTSIIPVSRISPSANSPSTSMNRFKTELPQQMFFECLLHVPDTARFCKSNET